MQLIVDEGVRTKADLLAVEFTIAAGDVENLCGLPNGWFSRDSAEVVRLKAPADREPSVGEGFRHRSSTVQPASALTIQEIVTIAAFHLSGGEHMRALSVRILSIIGVVAAGGAFTLWSGTGAAEAENIPAPMPPAITELPLERGYYVRTDATCATASNATTALLRRQGLYWGGSFCTFHGIEQTGPNTFRVKQFCSDPRAPTPPTPIPADWLTTADWVIKDRTSFSFKDSEGWEHEARLCAQQSMPAEYRRNNIAELIK